MEKVRASMKRSSTVGYKIRLIHNQIHKRMEAKRQENEDGLTLTGMQRWTMGFLVDHEGEDIYQRDIEAAFSVSRATASNMLQVMERKGLIKRVSVEHDARLKKLLLTEDARSMLERVERDVNEMEQMLIKGMTKEEVAVLMGYLDRIIGNLDINQENCHTRCSENRKKFSCKK